MNSIFLSVAQQLLAYFLPILVIAIVGAIIKFIGTQNASKIKTQIDSKKGLAADAVRFAQEVYKDLGGQTKFENALTALTNILIANKVPFKASELDILIHSALKDLKTAAGAMWDKIPDTTQLTETQESTEPIATPITETAQAATSADVKADDNEATAAAVPVPDSAATSEAVVATPTVLS